MYLLDTELLQTVYILKRVHVSCVCYVCLKYAQVSKHNKHFFILAVVTVPLMLVTHQYNLNLSALGLNYNYHY